MKRILMVAMLAVGGLLGVTATASADVGDVNRLTINDPLHGTASTVDVTGQIRCQATIEYGLWAGVAQGRPNSVNGDREAGFLETFLVESQGGGNAGPNASAEGVGAYGPNFEPPVGVADDSPCTQSISSYDVVVTQNRDSGDFLNGSVGVFVAAGSSAQNGSRGPGPFIGDVLLAINEDAGFTRTR